MASPCEVLVEGEDPALTAALGAAARTEVLRIERKFSRYRDDSVIAAINATARTGAELEVDAETADLLDFAARCHALSEGAFDVTSGVLRRAWRFDGSDRLPTPEAVAALLPLIGWQKLRWQRPRIGLVPGMELDLGGIGKEYAADRAMGIVRGQADGASVLVNLGGDLVVSGPRRDGAPWRVGIERPDAGPGSTAAALELRSGALCTSGDARRFLLKDGVRYGHILDPRSGWPVRDAPRSVTVAAPTCTEAGLLATLSMLAGAGAESLLAAQGVPHWIIR
jgi:thiamine biosynthesis lipoprotein